MRTVCYVSLVDYFGKREREQVYSYFLFEHVVIYSYTSL